MLRHHREFPPRSLIGKFAKERTIVNMSHRLLQKQYLRQLLRKSLEMPDVTVGNITINFAVLERIDFPLTVMDTFI